MKKHVGILIAIAVHLHMTFVIWLFENIGYAYPGTGVVFPFSDVSFNLFLHDTTLFVTTDFHSLHVLGNFSSMRYNT